MRRLAREMFGYVMASGCALLVDVAVLAILVRLCSWWYLTAATVSFIAGLFVAYAISVKFVFGFRRLKDQRIEFLTFAALGGLGLAINAAVIYGAVTFLGLNYLPAKCVAAGFTFVCNFFSRRQLLFADRSAARLGHHGFEQ